MWASWYDSCREAVGTGCVGGCLCRSGTWRKASCLLLRPSEVGLRCHILQMAVFLLLGNSGDWIGNYCARPWPAALDPHCPSSTSATSLLGCCALEMRLLCAEMCWKCNIHVRFWSLITKEKNVKHLISNSFILMTCWHENVLDVLDYVSYIQIRFAWFLVFWCDY